MTQMSSEEHCPFPFCQGCINVLAPLVKVSECLAFFQRHAQKAKEINNVDSVVLEESPEKQLFIGRRVATVEN